MPNPTINLTIEIIASLAIVTLAMFAISEPISRMRHYKKGLSRKSLKGAHRFGARQEKLDEVLEGKK